MADVFTETAPELLMILETLRAREPIFHRPRYARTPEDFARLMTPGYWEIGASGRRYSREFILEHLAANTPVDAEAAGWQPPASPVAVSARTLSCSPTSCCRATALPAAPRSGFTLPPAGKSSSTRARSSRPSKTTPLRLRLCKITARSSHGNAGAYSP